MHDFGPISGSPRQPSTLPLVLSTALGEFKVHTLPRQTLVDLRVRVESVVHTTSLLLIQNDLEDLAVILAGADALAHDFDRVDEIGENRIVNSCKCARTRTLLRLGGARAVAALGTR